MKCVSHARARTRHKFGASAIGRRVWRIASTGESTSSLERGTWWSASGNAFYGQSNDSGHSVDDVGTITIYQNGTAKWAAAGDTAGELVEVGDGLVRLESGTANKGFSFVIMPDDVSSASPTGTEHAITVAAGSIAGYVGFASAGGLVWQSILSGFRLDITGILGIGGTTTVHLIPRLLNVFKFDSNGRPLTSPPDVVLACCGSNDIGKILAGEPGYTMPALLANIDTIKDMILANGAIPIFTSVSYETLTAPRRLLVDEYNAYLAAIAAADSRVYFANYAAEVDDTESPTGNAKPDYMNGSHYTPSIGAKACGTVLKGILEGIAGTKQGRSSYIGDRPNLLSNGSFLINDGALTNATGVSSLDVSIGTGIIDMGDASAVCSKRDSEDGEYHKWQVISMTGGTEDSYGMATVPQVITLTGSMLQAECEFTISDSSMIGGGILDAFRMSFFFYDSEDNPIEYLAGIFADCGAAGELSGVLKTDVVTPPAGAAYAKLAWLWGQPALNDVVIEIANVGVTRI